MTVWATPWSNRFMNWAFMKRSSDLERVYAAIPVGIDILVSQRRPRLVICGHVHGVFGRFEHQGIPIYNVSLVDERYRLVNAPTIVDLPAL